jgi:hypothetical protein
MPLYLDFRNRQSSLDHPTKVLLAPSWKFRIEISANARRVLSSARCPAVRGLARDATTLAIREHLADVALQYDKLADGAEAGYREQELLADQA